MTRRTRFLIAGLAALGASGIWGAQVRADQQIYLQTACAASGGPIYGVGTISVQLGTNGQSGTSYPIQATDCGKALTFNNGSPVAVSLSAPATAGNGFWFIVKNYGAGTATLTPSSGQIDGGSNVPYTQGSGRHCLERWRCLAHHERRGFG